jgi:DNA repair protein RecO (recombination protein O)
MKLYNTEGIIFRTLKYSETSIICDIFTKEKGLRSYIVSGVRSSKSGSKAAIYRHLNIVDLVSYEVEADKLARIKEISLHLHYLNINTDVVISSVAIFILEICRNAIKEREANEELYQFIVEWLAFLDGNTSFHPACHLLFMVELSTYLGFGPLKNYSQQRPCFDMLEGMFDDINDGGAYILDADTSNHLSNICGSDRFQLHHIQMTKHDRAALTDHLIKYYQLHIPGFKDLNSLEILRSVM